MKRRSSPYSPTMMNEATTTPTIITISMVVRIELETLQDQVTHVNRQHVDPCRHLYDKREQGKHGKHCRRLDQRHGHWSVLWCDGLPLENRTLLQCQNMMARARDRRGIGFRRKTVTYKTTPRLDMIVDRVSPFWTKLNFNYIVVPKINQ